MTEPASRRPIAAKISAVAPLYRELPRDRADWRRRRSRVSQWNRRRKWRVFERYVGTDPEMSILDVGFSDQEFQITDNFLEKHHPHPERITALGIDEAPAVL